MLTLRKSSDRAHFNHGWLDTYHTFSFGDYYDPAWMSFGPLRVINEDVVAPGQGFPTHPHRDMEIITYILSGSLEHQDSLGNRGVISPGELQGMSAGTGIRHSEYNPSRDTPVHLLQIWIEPREKGLPARYDQRRIAGTNGESGVGGLRLIAAPVGSPILRDRRDLMPIYQDASILAGALKTGERASHTLAPNRRAWLQIARGEITLNTTTPMSAGDGAGLTNEPALTIEAKTAADVLLFDLP